ncbi:MAG: flagellar type III secretion system pore protein FliP [Holosporales bacterium]
MKPFLSPRRIATLSLAFFVVMTCGSLALAQSLNLDLGSAGGGSYTARLVQLVFILSVLSLAPSILVMMTSFTRIVVVLSFLRNALGLQQSPPNAVMVGLALFLTAFIMGPTLEKVYDEGIAPLSQEKISEEEAFRRGMQPLQGFMLKNVREKDLALFVDLANIEKPEKPEATPLKVLIPAFMISELRRAFEIGFLIFLPFLIIDMVVSSILMSMGMMMLPPMMISLPFKIIFFVLVDGWHLLVGSLVRGFAT